MADFTAEAALAKELIDANGRSVAVIKRDEAVVDANKPWRGADQSTTEFSVSGAAVFVPLGGSELGSMFDQAADNTIRGEQVCMFAADNDGGFPLEEADMIRDGSVNWSIVNTQVLRPAEQAIIYFFEVKA